jgi:hypothetical protein
LRLVALRDGHEAIPVVDASFGSRAVEPQLEQLTVTRAQLFELARIEIVVGVGVRVAGGVAIPRREVDPELHAGSLTRPGSFGYNITFVTGVRHRVIGGRCGPQAEAIVVLGGQHQVLGACTLSDIDPLGGVELSGREAAWVERAVAPLFVVEGVDPEVAKQAELGFLPLQLRGRRDWDVHKYFSQPLCISNHALSKRRAARSAAWMEK